MPSEWVVEIRENGSVDMLTRDRRSFQYDLDDLDEALAFVRRAEGHGVEVTVVEPDGYRRTTRT